MKISEYKIDDIVQVSQTLIDGTVDWRDGKVIEIKTIEPHYPEKHRPYPMVMVETTRTYYKATSVYKIIEGDIKVFDHHDIESYVRENVEGVIYDNEIRLKV